MDDDNSGTVEIKELKKAFKKAHYDQGLNKSEKWDSPKSSNTSRGYMKISKNNSVVSRGSGFSLSQARRKSLKHRNSETKRGSLI